MPPFSPCSPRILLRHAGAPIFFDVISPPSPGFDAFFVTTLMARLITPGSDAAIMMRHAMPPPPPPLPDAFRPRAPACRRCSRRADGSADALHRAVLAAPHAEFAAFTITPLFDER